MLHEQMANVFISFYQNDDDFLWRTAPFSSTFLLRRKKKESTSNNQLLI